MSYFEAKSDKNLISEFIVDVNELYKIEVKAEEQLYDDRFLLAEGKKKQIQFISHKNPEYQIIREKVTKNIQKVIYLGRKHGIPMDFKSIPPAMVGGAIIPVNVIFSILQDTSYQGVERQMVWDTLIQIEGACEENEKKAFSRLINPFFWIIEILTFVIRIPFILIQASGFNVSKVEDHFLGKLFKLIEIILLVAILLKLGFGKEDILRFFSK